MTTAQARRPAALRRPLVDDAELHPHRPHADLDRLVDMRAGGDGAAERRRPPRAAPARPTASDSSARRAPRLAIGLTGITRSPRRMSIEAMRFESRFGSGEQPTTAQVRVPVRIARTSSTGGSSGELRVRRQQPALREPVEHQRGVGDRHAGQVLLAGPRSRRRSPAPPPRTRAVPGRERGDGVGRAEERAGSRRACPRRRGRRACRCRPRDTPVRRAQQAGGEAIVGPELIAHVRDRVLAGQDRSLGVADQPAVAAGVAPPPTRHGRAAAARRRGSRASSPASSARWASPSAAIASRMASSWSAVTTPIVRPR